MTRGYAALISSVLAASACKSSSADAPVTASATAPVSAAAPIASASAPASASASASAPVAAAAPPEFMAQADAEAILSTLKRSPILYDIDTQAARYWLVEAVKVPVPQFRDKLDAETQKLCHYPMIELEWNTEDERLRWVGQQREACLKTLRDKAAETRDVASWKFALDITGSEKLERREGRLRIAIFDLNRKGLLSGEPIPYLLLGNGVCAGPRGAALGIPKDWVLAVEPDNTVVIDLPASKAPKSLDGPGFRVEVVFRPGDFGPVGHCEFKTERYEGKATIGKIIGLRIVNGIKPSTKWIAMGAKPGDDVWIP